MTPIIICTALFIFAFLVSLATRNRVMVEVVLWPGLVALFLLLLYNDYGLDIEMYKGVFDEVVPERFWEHITDKGYTGAIALVKLLGGDFYLFLAVINTFELWLLYKIFNRYSPLVALSWLIWFAVYMVYNNSALRQGIAIALTTYSLRYIIDGRWVKYLLIVTLAVTFHHATVIFIPAYWLARIRWSKRTFTIIIACAFPFIFVDTSGAMVRLASLVGIDEWYIQLYLESSGVMFVRQGFTADILHQLIFFTIFTIATNFKELPQRMIYTLWTLQLALFFPMASSTIISSRALHYYGLLDCILAPIAINNARNLWWRAFIVCYVLCYVIWVIAINFPAYVDGFPSALQMIIDSFET